LKNKTIHLITKYTSMFHLKMLSIYLCVLYCARHWEFLYIDL
jgi:hypothetical protein